MVSGTGKNDNVFFAGPQTEVSFSAGNTFLPCHFQKVHYVVALFKTKRAALEKILIGTELKPALKWGNHFLVALGLIQYLESDLGAYDEIILSVPSIPEDVKASASNWLDLVGPLAGRKMGQFIFHIPVTSSFSEAAGRELWGYPKIVTGIDHQFTPGKVDSKLYDPEGYIIMQVKGRLGFSIPSIPLSLMTYSLRNGQKIRTEVKVRGRMKLYLNQSLSIQIGDSDHPIARDLRLLGLNGAKPLLVMDSNKFQAVFNDGSIGWD